MAVKLIIDSGADTPIELASKYNIDVLPLTVISNDIEYRDGIDISPKEITDRMKEGDVFTTSQVSFEQFYNKFNEEVKKGNEIIYISLSGGISGCYNSSEMAKKEILQENPDAKIYLYNSKCAAFGIGLIAIRTSKLINEGYDAEYIFEKVKFMADNTEHFFTVDDMKYLYRGGRVTAAQKVLGGVLNIKPMLTVNKEDGKLISIDKARGLNQVYKKIISRIKDITKNNNILKEQTIFICHSDSLKNANILKDMVVEELGIKNIIVVEIGSTIGAHTGPGCIGIFVSREEIGDGLDII